MKRKNRCLKLLRNEKVNQRSRPDNLLLLTKYLCSSDLSENFISCLKYLAPNNFHLSYLRNLFGRRQDDYATKISFFTIACNKLCPHQSRSLVESLKFELQFQLKLRSYTWKHSKLLQTFGTSKSKWLFFSMKNLELMT